MTPATEKAAMIPAEDAVDTVAGVLASQAGRSYILSEDFVRAEEIVAALRADRASQEERVREDERDRLLKRARNEHGITAMWLVEEGAMLPADRARLRGAAS